MTNNCRTAFTKDCLPAYPRTPGMSQARPINVNVSMHPMHIGSLAKCSKYLKGEAAKISLLLSLS